MRQHASPSPPLLPGRHPRSENPLLATLPTYWHPGAGRSRSARRPLLVHYPE